MTEMTLVELKAAAYDRIAVRERADRELAEINQEIARRLEAERAAIDATGD